MPYSKGVKQHKVRFGGSRSTLRFAIVDSTGGVLLKSDRKRNLQDVLDGSIDLDEYGLGDFDGVDLSDADRIVRIPDEHVRAREVSEDDLL